MSPRTVFSTALVILIANVATHSHGTGAWQPRNWLEDSWRTAITTPEFFWELECKRIAKDFVPLEKRKVGTAPKDVQREEVTARAREAQREEAEKEDLKAAVKSGALKAEDKVEGTEFEDYEAGAPAYNAGMPDKARAAWEKLLKRPAAERKYRSTWATYMLGKLAIDEKRYEDAAKHFQITRQLAKDGFADSLGLAADSYGWEAKAELEAGHMDKAARLYLTQLALGDDSAVVSLKALIPDRAAALQPSYPSKDPEEIAKAAAERKVLDEALGKAATDPVLRRLITAHILAAGIGYTYGDNGTKPNPARQINWLKAVEKAAGKNAEDTEYLGWIAYTAGRYTEAARWLKLSSLQSAGSLWLKGKLALRDGKTAEAAAALSAALPLLPKEESLSISQESQTESPIYSLSGDLGITLISRGDFIQSLDTFENAGLWAEAEFVAERLLTTKELLDYAAKNYPNKDVELLRNELDAMTHEQLVRLDNSSRFREIVARRLVAEGRWKESLDFFHSYQRQLVEACAAAIAKGMDENLPKPERARALFHAAWLAHGERFPAVAFRNTTDRATQKPKAESDPDYKKGEKPKTITLVLPMSTEEKKRFATTTPPPLGKNPYRFDAPDLAWRAALLMPDGKEETADVLNTAGNWLKNINEKAADRFYQAIERRCSKTVIGKDCVKKHWFSGEEGPWSNEEIAADKAEEEAEQKRREEESKKRDAERAKEK
jgi:hypothetical protein